MARMPIFEKLVLILLAVQAIVRGLVNMLVLLRLLASKGGFSYAVVMAVDDVCRLVLVV